MFSVKDIKDQGFDYPKPKTISNDDFKNTCTQFVRSYSFLSQIIPFQDVELEKFFAYGKLFLNKLLKTNLSDRFKLGNEEGTLEY
ncbi:MAG TPA: hypothetical protein VK982_15680 [Bacteroidales bacterium]|nr:hypothetical protein [Bacteroidales bacterium]